MDRRRFELSAEGLGIRRFDAALAKLDKAIDLFI
jgi:hypothetical protein